MGFECLVLNAETRRSRGIGIGTVKGVMFMSISYNAGLHDDYSYLFQGISGNGGSNLNWLSDYSSIKNGSYGRLMKSYFGSMESSETTASGRRSRTSNVLDQILEEKRHPKVSKETQESNSKLTSGISSLSGAVSTLQNENTYTTTEGVRRTRWFPR